MQVRLLTSTEDHAAYQRWFAGYPEAPLWQSPAWAMFQQACKRETKIYVAEDAGKIVASALVVIDRTTGGYCTWDIPRGPLLSRESRVATHQYGSALLAKIVADAEADKAMSLYISPTEELPFLTTFDSRLTISPRHEQPEATILLDLTFTDEELMAQMKPKGRYNIRLAQKHGVTVEQSAHIQAYAELAMETAKRDGFTAPSERQFERFLRQLPGAFLLLAYPPSAPSGTTPQKPIAGLLGVTAGTMGIYYYGASSNEHRNLMAPYLLQWEAMRFCRTLGCTHYDLLGIAPPNAGPTHPWSGVTEFKAKFGGTVVRYPPEREIILRPAVRAALRLKRNILG